MYICKKCGYVFEDSVPYTEPHGEVTHGCPRCDETDFEESDKCDCGNHKSVSDWLCTECKSILDRRFSRFWASLTRDEQNYLMEFLEV